MKRKSNSVQTATNAEKRRANGWLLKYRGLGDQLRNMEQAAEDAITATRDLLAIDTAALRKKQKDTKARLEGFYRQHRAPKSRCLDLQDGRIGERTVPRIEVPKSAIDKVPREALSVKTKINKTALRALGPDALAAAGARIVRPLRFYVRTADEDAEK